MALCAAPAVSWAVTRSRSLRRWLILATLLLAAFDLACALVFASVTDLLLLHATTLLVLSAAWRQHRISPTGILYWTGLRWHWDTFNENAVPRIDVALELPRLLLLRLQVAGQPVRWLWLDGPDRSDPVAARWRALRRALVWSGRQRDAGLASGRPDLI